jgi:Zn-dependent peptidase ImmA (M78 family)
MNVINAVMYARNSAKTLVQTVWLDRGFPIDPIWIAGKLGVSVIEADLPNTVLGSLVKDKGKDPVILLNQSDEQEQKRFHCAHKIGHFAEHQRRQDVFYKHIALADNHPSADPQEIFANQFGKELLMPEEELRRLQAQGLSNVAMAKYFGVPEEVMRTRIAETRLCA